MSEQASSSDDAPVATIQGLSTSVFDRIRAAKGQAKPRNVSTEAQPVGDADATRSPKSATLDDVAHAILTARSTRTPQEREDTEFLDLSDEATTANLPPTQPPPPVGGEVWKNSVITSINDTREELKRAHDSVTRLRRQFTEIDRKRRKRRVQIAASLDRAESLLDEFQNAWR